MTHVTQEGVDVETLPWYTGFMDINRTPQPPSRSVSCPHCFNRTSPTDFSIHVRFECPVIRPKESQS